MVIVKCIVEGCGTRPSYGDPVVGDKTHCKHHRDELGLDHFVKIARAKCTTEGCGELATDGYMGHPPTKCREHIEDGMSKSTVKWVACAYTGCNEKTTHHHTENNVKFYYCSTHKPVDSICNVKSCESEGCTSHAMVGNPRRFCIRHSSLEAKERSGLYCIEAACHAQACYGVIRATHCEPHHKDGMARLKKACSEPGCNTVYSITAPDGRHWCVGHNPTDLVPPKKSHVKCSYQECGLNAYYKSVSGRWCTAHRPTDEEVTCTRKQCAYPDCEKCPAYGFDKKIYCREHKEDAMVNVSRGR